MKYLYVKSVFLWLSAVSVALLGACSGESFETSYDDEGAISFSTPQTRAAIEDASKMESFSVWGWYRNTATGGIPISVFNNTIVTQSSGWNYEGGTRYWIPGNTYNFYGVYPTLSDDKVNIGTGIITITDFDCSVIGKDAVDLMTAFATGDGDNPQKVNMNFGHELARVSIVIRSRFADAVLSQASLYGIAVKGQLSATEASSSWKVKSLVTNESTPYKFNGQYTIEAGKELNLWEDLLVIPQALDDLKLKVQYTNAGGTLQESEISLVTSTLQEWVAGKSYRYTLTIEPDGILFENLTADAWGETSSGGSIIIH